MKDERCWPDEGWDTTGLCLVVVLLDRAGPCAGHAVVKVGILRGISACPAKVIFYKEPEIGEKGKNKKEWARRSNMFNNIYNNITKANIGSRKS